MMSKQGGAMTHHDEYESQNPHKQRVQSAFFRIAFSSL